MGKSVYQIVTDRIVKKLEQGVVPWRKPWINGVAVNWKTQLPYRGINVMLLEPGEYATKKQIIEAGGKLKKNARFDIVVFWKWIEVEDEETGEVKQIPFLRYYKVYEINSQVEGLESKQKIKEFNHDPIEAAEAVIKGYVGGPDITYSSGKACYYPLIDTVNVPPLKHFEDVNQYYSTFFHELVHSTGHEKRLNRPGITKYAAFGDETYSKEELVAELGAAMLCGHTGIDNSTLDQSASYIQSWLRKLKNDKTLIIQAAAQAQKAADYILNRG